jgi:NAD(P)-dependent dehydrogenase (short-subunit alcohol dehydrogenase family)
LFEATADDFDRLYHTNVRGSFLFTKDVAERMADRGEGGRVVTVTSVNGIRPGVGLWLYGSTKAALEVMMKGLAMELAPYRILVNTIAAGAVDTDMTRGAREDEELYRTVNEGIPLNRFARADEIAHFACALLADGASYATGTTITVDGGLLLMRGYGKPKRYER